MNYYGRFRFAGLSPNKVCIGTLTPGEIKKCIQMFTFAKSSLIGIDSPEIKELLFTNEFGFKIGVFKGSKEWKILFSTNYLSEEDQVYISASEIDNVIAVFQNMKNKIDSLNQ